MYRFLVLCALLIGGCVSEAPRQGSDDDVIACASAPSGAGAWEDVGPDGLHCNYFLDGGGDADWAYGLNWYESSCLEASWAPEQRSGYVSMWEADGTRGCDWIIPW